MSNLTVAAIRAPSGASVAVQGLVVSSLATALPTLVNNLDMTFQLVSNTQLKILVKGSDGVTRSTTLTLA